MAWPLSQDYNEAIQDSRGSFSDAELRQGQVVTNALGLPMPRSGSFADVYQVCSADGRMRWAVKCFTRQVVGLRERYNEISKYLRQLQLPFMVEFQYLEQGIRVRGQWYPILKMHWVEGFLLNEFVRNNLDKPVLLGGLGQIWLRMARKLREAKLAHCDLQHGNVILVPGSRNASLAVKLIDYDGMFVPSLAGSKSGEVGHPAYQHPQRLQTGAYHGEVDRFPLLVVATALQGLAVAGRSLWDRYDNGDNLLFRQRDLQNPAQSPLFAELRQVRDPLTQSLVRQLWQACGQPLEKTPLLESLYPPEQLTTAPRTAAASAPGTAPKTVRTQTGAGDFSSLTLGTSSPRRRRRSSGWLGALGAMAVVLLLMLGAAGAFWMLLGRSPSDVAQNHTAATGNKTPTQVADAKDPHREASQEKAGPAEKRGPPEREPDRSLPPRTGSADGQRSSHLLQVGCGKGVQLLAWARPEDRSWNLKDLKGTILFLPFNGHTKAVTCITFCNDGKRVLTGSADRTVRLWAIDNGQHTIHTLEGHTRPVTCVAVSPDGRYAASADGSADVLLWDLDSGKKICTLSNPRPTRSLSFSANGRKVLCGLERPETFDGEVICCRWHSVENPLKHGSISLPMDQAVTAVALSSDAKRAVLGGDSVLWIVEVRSKGAGPGAISVQRQPLNPPSGTVHHIVFSRDGQRFLVSAQTAAYLYGADSSQVLAKPYAHVDHVDACFSEDEKQMLVATQHGDSVSAEPIDLPDGP